MSGNCLWFLSEIFGRVRGYGVVNPVTFVRRGSKDFMVLKNVVEIEAFVFVIGEAGT